MYPFNRTTVQGIVVRFYVKAEDAQHVAALRTRAYHGYIFEVVQSEGNGYLIRQGGALYDLDGRLPPGIEATLVVVPV